MELRLASTCSCRRSIVVNVQSRCLEKPGASLHSLSCFHTTTLALDWMSPGTYHTPERWACPYAYLDVGGAGPVLLFFAAALPAKFVVRGLVLG